MNFQTLQTNAHKAALFAVTAWAVVYGLFSYLYLAFELFWDEYGDTILTGMVRFAFNTAEFSRDLYLLGQDCRRFLNEQTEQWSDRAYFYATGFYS